MDNEKYWQSETYKVLRRQIIEIKAHVEDYKEHLPFKSSILRVLFSIEDNLNRDTPDVSNLNKDANAIFRLVTESAKLERSSIGKELLSMLETLRNFVIEVKRGLN